MAEELNVGAPTVRALLTSGEVRGTRSAAAGSGVIGVQDLEDYIEQAYARAAASIAAGELDDVQAAVENFLPATSTGSIAAAIALAGPLLLATPAAAAPSVTVQGDISCINNASPVGVWIEAEKSTSGWAKTKVPIKALGHTMVTYSYTLNKGGRYKVHVGCGGNSKKWGMTLKSGYISGSTNNLACNDIHPALQAAMGKVPRVGKIAKQLDLAQGVKYQTCGKK